MNATIRNATIEDLPAIVAIYNAAIPGRMATADLEPVSVDSRRAWLHEHSPSSRPLWVIEDGGEIRGWLSFQSFYGRPAYRATAELSVYVATDAQRRGYARKLVAEAIRRAPELGVKTMLGFIFGHNEPSLALFGSYGFEKWAHLPRVAEMDGLERDLLILGLRLSS
ncbi:MAG TPA: GNAT family N-acetyltransferase [Candidatus Binataceae bacterium]|nr:GNAT family N-acetyltransferase [Candidatus Binataceae bacterium]